MVGLLWTRGRMAAAIRLEECWNDLLRAEGCSLFCAYPIDVFGLDFESRKVDAVLCAHTHFIPAEDQFETAIDRAIGEVVPGAESVRLLLKTAFPSWDSIPRVEVIVLWIRRNLPEFADAILERARGYTQPRTLPGAV